MVQGAQFQHSPAFSFQVATDSPEETDLDWDAIIGTGGEASYCGWRRGPVANNA